METLSVRKSNLLQFVSSVSLGCICLVVSLALRGTETPCQTGRTLTLFSGPLWQSSRWERHSIFFFPFYLDKSSCYAPVVLVLTRPVDLRLYKLKLKIFWSTCWRPPAGHLHVFLLHWCWAKLPRRRQFLPSKFPVYSSGQLSVHFTLTVGSELST